MSEKALWTYINSNIGWAGHFSRVESHATSAGIPDVDYCIDRVEGHLELKYSSGKPYKTRATQVAWFRNRTRKGGRPYILAQLDLSDVSIFSIYSGIKYESLHLTTQPEDWLHYAMTIWRDNIDFDELIGVLRHEWLTVQPGQRKIKSNIRSR